MTGASNQEYAGQNLRGKTLDRRRSYFKENFVGTDARGVDFSGLDLRGADFSGAKLSGANFSQAHIGGTKFNKAQLQKANFVHASTEDISLSGKVETLLENTSFCSAHIEGVNFSHSDMSNADFTDAQAGSFKLWHSIIILLSFLASLFAGFFSAILTTFLLYYFWIAPRQNLPKPNQNLTVPFLLLVGTWSTLLVSVFRTIVNNLLSSNQVSTSVLFATGLIVIILLLAGILADEAQASMGSMFFIVVFLLLALITLQSQDFFSGPEQNLAESFNFIGEWLVKGLGNGSGEPIIWKYSGKAAEEYTQGQWMSGIAGALIGAFIGCWFSNLAIAGDDRFSWLWKAFTQVIALKGTTFESANLTNAIFNHSFLQSTSFYKACIFKIRWDNARCLDCAYFGNSYLKYPQIRYLVVRRSLRGRNQFATKKNVKESKGINLNELELEGINLQEANLRDASLIRTNLSHANLINANLQDANLKKSILDDADLQGANLTGACIEGWAINEGTQLNGVKCDYIYLKDAPDPKTGITERLPNANAGEDFQPGEFEALYRKDNLSVQLYIRDTYNRGALSEAFQQLANDQESFLQGFEIIGDSALVKVGVPPKASKDYVSSKFYQTLKNEQESHMKEDNQSSENQSWREFVLNLAGIIASNSGSNSFTISDSNIDNITGDVTGVQNINQNKNFM